jgi:hypothetical protein
MAGVMFPPRQWRLPAFALAVACLVSSLSAEIRETRLYHGKKVQCIHGGNYLNPIQTCGTQFYARVFTGTVNSVVEISDTDKRLVLIPDEVFVGPASEVTATVNQACMPQNVPEIKSGDKWVFYLRSPGFSPNDTTVRELSVPYDSPSKPLSQGHDDIAMLRHLERLTDKGILNGNVERIGETYDNLNPTPVANLKIVAKSVSDGAEYGAVTNRNGHFEFELPKGSYDVNVDTERGLREAEGVIPRGNPYVREKGCVNTDFTLLTDGRLSGRVTTADGKPASFVKVSIIPIAPVHPQFTVSADKDGRFEAAGRQPGQYIIGVGLLAPFDSAEWKSRVYYPGVPTQEAAKIIELGDGEWRTDIDFKLLPTAQ